MADQSTSIFERTSALARELGAINLGQGFPDLPEPFELLAAAQRALVEHPNQYPPMRGLPELRRAVCRYYRAAQSLEVLEQEVIVTSGATEALAAAILAFIQPGDEAIVFQPFYDAYLPLVERAGGTVRTVSLVPPRWTLPLDRFEAAIRPRTRLVILNTPNNPTGTVVDRATLEAIGALCERHDLILLCDEVWEAMIYGGAEHVSPLAIPTLRERAVKVGSAGKIFSLTGWKVGWIVAPPSLGVPISKAHQYVAYATPPNLQAAVAWGLGQDGGYYDRMVADFAASRAVLTDGLDAAGYRVLAAEGTYFLNLDLAASGIPLDDATFCDRAVAEAGVAAIPLSAFYAEAPVTNVVRLCFAKKAETLEQGIERMNTARLTFRA